MKISSWAYLLSVLFAGAAFASPATIRFTALPTGVNDGNWAVLPYEVTIDGVPQLVTCYDTWDEATPGDIWTANVLTLEQAAATGYFAGSAAGYQRVAWLDAQIYSNVAEQIGLQYAIWNVFGHAPGATAESAQYEAAANLAASGGYAGFDFSSFRFIEQVDATAGAGAEQAFVFAVPGFTGNLLAAAAAPEPASVQLWIGGLLVLAGVRRTRAGAGKRQN